MLSRWLGATWRLAAAGEAAATCTRGSPARVVSGRLSAYRIGQWRSPKQRSPNSQEPLVLRKTVLALDSCAVSVMRSAWCSTPTGGSQVGSCLIGRLGRSVNGVRLSVSHSLTLTHLSCRKVDQVRGVIQRYQGGSLVWFLVPATWSNSTVIGKASPRPVV